MAALTNVKTFIGQTADKTFKLSPAEKVDLALSRLDFPLVKQDQQLYAENAATFKEINWGWIGHCHGWASASLMESAPKSGVLFKNSDGQATDFFHN